MKAKASKTGDINKTSKTDRVHMVIKPKSIEKQREDNENKDKK